jgi:hypothetical protein
LAFISRKTILLKIFFFGSPIQQGFQLMVKKQEGVEAPQCMAVWCGTYWAPGMGMWQISIIAVDTLFPGTGKSQTTIILPRNKRPDR